MTKKATKIFNKNSSVHKIAFFINNLNGGGAERVALTIANILASQGYSIILILNKKSGPYLSDVSKAIKLVELGGRMRYSLPNLYKTIKTNQIDTIFSFLDQPNIALLLIKPFLKKTKIIVTECNNPLHSPRNIKYQFFWRFIRFLKPLLYPFADHIISKSKDVKYILNNQFNCPLNNITVINNPVDTIRINKMITATNKNKADLNRIPQIVAVGRLHEQKDFPTLFHAISLLVKKIKLKLLVLGEGQEYKKLLELRNKLGLMDIIEMPGFVDNPYQIISSSDCFVLSSRWEGWPNCLLESLACGTPVVSTDCISGPREILKNGELGLLVKVGDAEGLADAIYKTLNEQVPSYILIKRAEEFTPERAAKMYLNISMS